MGKTIEEICKDLRERQKEKPKREKRIAGHEQDKVVMKIEGSRQELVEMETILENDYCDMISESAWTVLRNAHEDEEQD